MGWDRAQDEKDGTLERESTSIKKWPKLNYVRRVVRAACRRRFANRLIEFA